MIYKCYRTMPYEPQRDRYLIEADSKHKAFKEYLARLYEDENYSRNANLVSSSMDICIVPVKEEILKIEMLQNQDSVKSIELNI